MWELDYKGSWTPKYWCFWTVVLEKALESPLDCKETKPVNPKGNQSWIFIGRTDAEAEAPILWQPDAGEDWRQEKGDNRGWDIWTASSTQWMWIWVSSRSWWRVWRPGMLQSMGLLRVDTTEQLNWTKMSEKHVSKAMRGWKLVLQCLIISQLVDAKRKFLKEIKIAPPGNIQMVWKWISVIADTEKVLMV